MRHNQNRRSRGRSRKSPNPLSRSYESNGPDIKVRGNAAHVAEKYSAMARDSLASGDTVAAENYFQHAEHYNRIVAAAQAQFQQSQPQPQAQAQPEDGEDEAAAVNGDARPGPHERGNGRGFEAADGGEDGEQHRRPRRRSRQDPAQAASADSSAEAGNETAADQRRSPGDRVEAGQDAGARADEEKPENGRRPRRRRSEPAEAAADDSATGPSDAEQDKTRDGTAALAAFPD